MFAYVLCVVPMVWGLFYGYGGKSSSGKREYPMYDFFGGIFIGVAMNFSLSIGQEGGSKYRCLDLVKSF